MIGVEFASLWGYIEVITGPARRATAAGQRLRIESALVERLLGEAEGADALPLVATTRHVRGRPYRCCRC